MKQKLRNLSAPANIIFAILAVFIFIAPLQWSGKDVSICIPIRNSPRLS